MPARSTTSAVSATSAAKTASSVTLLPVLPPEAEKNRDSRTIAAKSATVAAAIVVWPTALPDWPASFSTGTTSPSDVADRVMARSNGALASPTAVNNDPSPSRGPA